MNNELNMDLIRLAGSDGPTLDREAVATLWGSFGIEDEWIRDEVIEAIVATCQPVWDGEGAPPRDALSFRFGRWHIDLRAAGVNVGILYAVAGGFIAMGGDLDVSTAAIAGFLPAVMEVRRQEIDGADRSLALEIRSTKAFREGWASPDTLYASLSEDTKRTLNRHDFAGFVERMADLGLVDGDADTWMQLRPPNGKD